MGRFSKKGVYTVTQGQLQIAGVVGPMARDVSSLVTMTQVLASPDMFELDPSLPPLPFNTQELKSTRPLTIGFYTWDGNLPPVPVVSRALREARAALEERGHTLVEFQPPQFDRKYGELYMASMVGGDQAQTIREKVKGDNLDLSLSALHLTRLPRWLISLLANLTMLKEPVLGRALKYLKSDGRTYSWFRHVTRLQEYKDLFTRQWRSQGLDAVICPVFPSPAPLTQHMAHLTCAGSGAALYNVVNFPAGVVPVTKVTPSDVADVNNPCLYPAKTRLEGMLKKSCSSTESVGLPVGVQCVTLPFREELCLRVMAELEASLDWTKL